MSDHIDLNLKPDHISGGFEWEIEPKCKCNMFKQAIDDKFIYVSNFTDGGMNNFYMLPVAADGTLIRDNGVVISHCPWCGDKIKARKKYPIGA